MLVMILTRLENDQQRKYLLESLRRKLSKYNFNWYEIGNIIRLFDHENRFEILKFLLSNLENFTDQLQIKDFLDLCTNQNEQLNMKFFEFLYNRLNIEDDENDLEQILQLFSIETFREQIRNIFEKKKYDIYSLKNSCSSCSSLSDEYIPLRTRSFMLTIKRTFEH